MSTDFKATGTLLGAAAAVVVSVFGLFGLVLRDLGPPSTQLSPHLYAGIASFAALIVLLFIAAALPSRLSQRQRLWVAGFTAACGVAAVCALLYYVQTLNTYVFRFPDQPKAEAKANRYIRGEFTYLGETITKDMTVAAAIESLGGLETVRSNQLLWTEQSQKATEMLLVVRYVVAVTLLCAALFSFAAVGVRTTQRKPA